jgi:hypothetical protein
MHIYWGYGSGAQNDPGWFDSEVAPLAFDFFDRMIMRLKSCQLPERVLLKQPTGIDQGTPKLDPKPEHLQELWRRVADMHLETFQRDGFAQPKDQSIALIRDWKHPVTPWLGKQIYENGGRDFYLAALAQCDPRRVLFAWTQWDRANLRPGQAIVLIDEHIMALAKWLKGLNGMTIKVLQDSELDWSGITYPPEVRELYISSTGNEHGIKHDDCVVVCHPKFYPPGTVVERRSPQSADGQTASPSPTRNDRSFSSLPV